LVTNDKKKKKSASATNAATTKAKQQNDPFPELVQTLEKALSLVPVELLILDKRVEAVDKNADRKSDISNVSLTTNCIGDNTRGAYNSQTTHHLKFYLR
jgi:hypothetical protein